ncbi:hypothetical protein [Paenibacillus sp. UNC451MF]|uniref:hypothetical protein n=1 Tax=Paenibacillus sp. UNC451MF TaxID=1449063 RepID=UPI00068A480A|nr:hypothetical protein [Paenibacillus sp. UNC451MF]
MKYKQLLGMCALLAVIASGCGTAADGSAKSTANAAGSTNTPAAQAQDQKQDANQNTQDKQQKTAMSQGQRQMMMTFQELIRMDKQEGLGITKEQAAQMLPVVQDSVTKDELTTDNQTKLVEKLTAEQKKFIDDAASRTPMRQGTGDANGGEAKQKQAPTEEQLKKMEENKQQRQQQKSDAEANGQDNKDKQPRNGGFPGGGKDIGQQLIELLQSKSK